MLSGIGRIKYMPYSMDLALTVVQRIGRSFNPLFSLTQGTTEFYKEMIRYFHGDPEFNGNLQKGLLIMGPTGTGKTLALKIMKTYRGIDNIRFIFNQKIYNLNYEITHVHQLMALFHENAFDGIDIYCRRYIDAFDDIGCEQKVKHYGTELDIMSHILTERYTRNLLTFGTTNLNTEALEQRYNDRIVSRLHEMVNLIVLNCQDFRKEYLTKTV